MLDIAEMATDDVYLWAQQYPVTDAMEEADVDWCTATDIYINGCEKYAPLHF